MRNLEPITETAYLTAINAPRYRKIMRIFFLWKMRWQSVICARRHRFVPLPQFWSALRDSPELQPYPMKRSASGDLSGRNSRATGFLLIAPRQKY